MADTPKITVLDQNEGFQTILDNTRPKALHYRDEVFHTYLTGTACTFEATILKSTPDAELIQEGYKLAFRYRGKDYSLTIMKITENEKQLKVMALGVSLEANNTEVDAYAADKEMAFIDYMRVFDTETTIFIGFNEVADRKRKLSWDGTSTLLARMLSLANKFDAEIEFETVLYDNYTTKDLRINIYKKESEKDQGIGQYRPEVKLEYGKNIETIEKDVDITNIKTAIRPIGKDGLNLIGEKLEEKDEHGNILFQMIDGSGWIYAPQARDRFPSNNFAINREDRYIGTTWTYETADKAVLKGQGLARLKELCQPVVNYTVAGYFDLDLGDTVRLVDEGYTPTLLLEARVAEQEICWTDPSKNKTVFTNYKELLSEIDKSLLDQMQELIDQNKQYNCEITTTNGTVFKADDGTTDLTARVLNGTEDVTDTLKINWFKNAGPLKSGKTITVTAKDFVDSAVYRYETIDPQGKNRGGAELTVINVRDGEGVKTIDYYYALSDSDKVLPTNWQDTIPPLEKGKYLWKKIVFTMNDGSESISYDISYSGDDGSDGKGIRDTEVTYCASASGTEAPKTGWTDTIPDTKPNEYLWTRTITIYSDNTTTTAYSVSKMGANGVDAKSIRIVASGQVMSFTDTNDPTSLQTITFELALQNLVGQAAWLAIPYIGTNPQPAITLGGQGSKKTLTSNQWEYKSWTSITITATVAGYSDSVTVIKVRDGGQGEPTGVTESATIPSNPFPNMLWKCTGNLAGYIINTIYRWTGVKWVLFNFSAENIQADSLSAITANLGTVTAGSIQGKNGYWHLNDGEFRSTSSYNASEYVSIQNGEVASVTTDSRATLASANLEVRGLRSGDKTNVAAGIISVGDSVSDSVVILKDRIQIKKSNGQIGNLTYDNLYDSGWVGATLANGCTGGAEVRQQGKLVTFRCGIGGLANRYGIAIALIPKAMAPSKRIWTPGTYGGNVSFLPDGQVVQESKGLTWVDLTVTYAIG